VESSTVSVTSREWVAAFYAILGIALVAIFGFHAITILIALVFVVLTMLAYRACSSGQFTYWKGLRLVASINPTGETLLGQFFVLPALAIASLLSWALGILWLLGAREWPRSRWIAFLRGYEAVLLRKPRQSGR
jgi:hypothetical protein